MNYLLSHPRVGALSSYGVIFVFVFVTSYLSLKSSGHYFFDPRDFWRAAGRHVDSDEVGNFEPHAKRYQELAKLLITLATAAIAFLAKFTVEFDSTKASVHATNLFSAAPLILCMLTLTVVSGLLFVLSQTYFYEQYVHSLKRDSYKPWKYSVSVSLGVSALLVFSLSLLPLGWALT